MTYFHLIGIISLNKQKSVIYCNKVTNEIYLLATSISNISSLTISGYSSDKIYILNLNEIYSFYSESGRVYAKTNNNIYTVKYRLYELENLLNFKNYIRISKNIKL